VPPGSSTFEFTAAPASIVQGFPEVIAQWRNRIETTFTLLLGCLTEA